MYLTNYSAPQANQTAQPTTTEKESEYEERGADVGYSWEETHLEKRQPENSSCLFHNFGFCLFDCVSACASPPCFGLICACSTGL